MTKILKFKTTVKFDEKSYVAIFKTKIDSETSKYKIKFFIRLFIALVITGLSFLNTYTSIIGILIILIYLYIFFENKLLIFAEKIRYLTRDYLREESTYLVDDKEIYIKDKIHDIKIAWSSLYSWHKRGDWLILAFYEAPRVFLPIHQLKEVNLYEKILSLAKKNGKEYK